MVETIFEDKVVEETDMGSNMQFPGDANINYLPSDCRSTVGRELSVKDENGTPKKLTCKIEKGKMCFTKGWREFREAKRIKAKANHKISFYKDDDSGPGAQYTIIVKKN